MEGVRRQVLKLCNLNHPVHCDVSVGTCVSQCVCVCVCVCVSEHARVTANLMVLVMSF